MSYKLETLTSTINISGILEDTKIWQNLLSFYFWKMYEDLNVSEISKAKAVFTKYSKNGILEKSEDYIWIEKPSEFVS